MSASDTGRIARTAATWVKKATAHLRHDAANASHPELLWLTGYDAETLLAVLLEEADWLVDLLNDYDDLNTYERERIERLARALAQRLRNERLASKLSNVEGRTPEEAQAFLGKASEIRSAPADPEGLLSGGAPVPVEEQ